MVCADLSVLFMVMMDHIYIYNIQSLGLCTQIAAGRRVYIQKIRMSLCNTLSFPIKILLY